MIITGLDSRLMYAKTESEVSIQNKMSEEKQNLEHLQKVKLPRSS